MVFVWTISRVPENSSKGACLDISYFHSSECNMHLRKIFRQFQGEGGKLRDVWEEETHPEHAPDFGSLHQFGCVSMSMNFSKFTKDFADFCQENLREKKKASF